MGVRPLHQHRHSEGKLRAEVLGRGETARRPHPVLRFRRGTLTPLATLFTRRCCVSNTVGRSIGVTWRTLAGRLVGVGQQSSPLLSNCTINVRLRGFAVARNTSYVATIEPNDINGMVLKRRLTIRGVQPC